MVKKECKHHSICDAGYGKKRCTCCDKILVKCSLCDDTGIIKGYLGISPSIISLGKCNCTSEFISKAPRGMFRE